MGQSIQVNTTVLGDVLILDGNRGITGQDGTVYDSSESAAADDRFPGRLASQVFEADAAIDHVFVAGNQTVVRRRGGWTEEMADRLAGVVSEFFVHYR